MIRRIAASFVLALQLVATAAWAADNSVILTPGVGVTMRSKDVGSGVESMIQILGDTSGNPLATVPGTGNTVFALPMQGVAGGVAVPVSSATLSTAAEQALQLAQETLIATNSSAPVPCSVTAAWNTNTGLTGTQPANCNGSANLFVDLGKNNGAAGTPSTSFLSVQGGAGMTPINASLFQGTTSVAVEACQTGTKVWKPINGISTGTTTLLVLNSGSGAKVYVCHIFLNTSIAEGISIVDGTTAGTCSGGIDALIGDTTANTSTAGVQLTANQGYSLGSGGYAIAATAANKDLCIVTGSTGVVRGSIVTVTQ